MVKQKAKKTKKMPLDITLEAQTNFHSRYLPGRQNENKATMIEAKEAKKPQKPQKPQIPQIPQILKKRGSC